MLTLNISMQLSSDWHLYQAPTLLMRVPKGLTAEKAATDIMRKAPMHHLCYSLSMEDTHGSYDPGLRI